MCRTAAASASRCPRAKPPTPTCPRRPLPRCPRRGEELLFAFSAKEAIYKALDPFLQRYVSFHEVAVERHPDGAASATLHLKSGAAGTPASEPAPPFDVELRWLRYDDYIVTTAKLSRRASS